MNSASAKALLACVSTSAALPTAKWSAAVPGVPQQPSPQNFLERRQQPYAYEHLISQTVSFCYDSIIKKPSCCVDQKFHPGVTRHTLRRPGAEWTCGKGCFDKRKGRRGEDSLWVPHEATCESPRLLWVHGGSWLYDSPMEDGYGQLTSKVAGLSGAVVMANDYPLAPVGNYSTIVAAALEALKWLAEAPVGGSDCRGVQPPLFIAGDSSGGGTALSLVLKLKLAGGWSPKGITRSHPEALPGGQILAGAIFFSPWTNLRCDTPDYYYNSFARIVAAPGDVYVGDLMFRGHPEQNLDEFTANAKSYVGNDESLLTDPIASPFFATEQELGGGGLPPMYFAVGASESILGDSLIFAQKAALYGASVKLDVHVGMWHDFPMYSEGCGSGEELWQAVRALNRTAQFIRRVGEEKRTASRLGMLWPPARDSPGTPKTNYVYDLTRPGTRKWFPVALDALSDATQYSAQVLLERAAPGAAPTAPPEAAPLHAAAGPAACAALATLLLQVLWGKVFPRHWWQPRLATPLLQV